MHGLPHSLTSALTQDLRSEFQPYFEVTISAIVATITGQAFVPCSLRLSPVHPGNAPSCTWITNDPQLLGALFAALQVIAKNLLTHLTTHFETWLLSAAAHGSGVRSYDKGQSFD